jgi:hypothetical protein
LISHSIFFRSSLIEQVTEANSTKEAINEAYSAVENTAASAHHEEHHAVEQQKNQAVRQSDIFESNLFSGGFDAPAPAPFQEQQHMYPPPIQKTMSYDSADSNQFSVPLGSVASGSLQNQSAPPIQVPPQQASRGMTVVQTVSSDDEDQGGVPAAGNNGGVELFSNEFEPPAPAPETEEPQNPEQPEPANMGMPPPQQFQHPPPQQQHPPPQQQHPPPQQQQYQQPTPPQQAQSLERPAALGTHNRQTSGFASDFVMGGAAMPLSEEVGESAVSPAARTYSDSSAYGYDDDDEYQNVEELKKKAESARETAGDAEAAHRNLVNEADELRQDADKAEAMSRSLRAAAEEKKKGAFGGKKKKMMVRTACNY